MLYEDLTGKILESAFEVSRESGAGFLESVYERALMIVLRQKNLNAVRQVPLKVKFRGEVVGDFYADVLVENKVIVELKSVSRTLPEHKAQVINYLKATGIDIGLLINFGNPKLEYYRFHK